MAEFCLECWNRINETDDDAKKYVISKDLWLCEGCAEFKPVIIAERKYYYLRKLRVVLFPVHLFCLIVYLLWRILLLPYLLWDCHRNKQ